MPPRMKMLVTAHLRFVEACSLQMTGMGAISTKTSPSTFSALADSDSPL